ncbi:hypothetical protein K2Y11_09425 [bacterium]|nr:hypothetical protein [bacterium]
MKRMMTNRRGASLAEVLVAVVVLSVGLTSVVALFPVGISRIRNATLDTRTTIIAANAINTFEIKRMANDPGIVDWPIYDNYIAINGTLAFDDAYRNPLAFIPYAPGAGGWMDASGGNVIPSDRWAYWASVNSISLPSPNRSITPATIPDVTLPMWTQNLLFSITGSESLVNAPSGMCSVTDASAGFDYSYPVLLDPWLYDQLSNQFGMMDTSTLLFPSGVPRISIGTTPLRADGSAVPGLFPYYSAILGAGVPTPYCDIAVLSLSEMTLLPPTISTTAFPNPPLDRELVKTRWFSSLYDVQYSTETAGQLQNPSGSDYLTGTNPLVVQNYYVGIGVGGGAPTITNPVRATASRSYEYTWAAMFQRKLVTDPLRVGSVARPNPNDREFRGKVSIMCFYRRNLQQPYTVIEGCFYNGSRRATLSWPTAYGAAPTINIGTWLCEASVSRSSASDVLQGSCSAITGQYSNSIPADLARKMPNNKSYLVKRIYRRSYSFHQVTDVTEPQMDTSTNRVYVQVTLARPAIGYPLHYQNPTSGLTGAQSDQDERGIDLYPAVPTWPIFDCYGNDVPSNFDDETNVSQSHVQGIPVANYSFYFPVIIFDGLREVFEYER